MKLVERVRGDEMGTVIKVDMYISKEFLVLGWLQRRAIHGGSSGESLHVAPHGWTCCNCSDSFFTLRTCDLIHLAYLHSLFCAAQTNHVYNAADHGSCGQFPCRQPSSISKRTIDNIFRDLRWFLLLCRPFNIKHCCFGQR